MNTLVVRDLRFLDWGPISFEVPAGACAALSGPSGSGKTLLLRALADLDEHSGTVLLNGQPSQVVPAPAWRSRMGLLPADPQWWRQTVGEHFPFQPDLHEPGTACKTSDAAVAIPRACPCTAEALEAILGSLGFEPEVLGWPVTQLSAGEKQRLALARLLSRGPEALLLDEPSAFLDAENRQRLESLMARYRREHQAPVVWVSHDQEQIRRVASSHFHMRNRRLQVEWSS